MRHELKFKVNMLQYEQIKAQCYRMLHVDPNGKDGVYTVRSLYFDTLSNRDYYNTISNAYSRHKMRLRTYGTDNKVFNLEKKYKEGSLSNKKIVLLSPEQAAAVAGGDYSVLQEADVKNDVCMDMINDLYIPKLVVQYKRTAFYLDIDNFRLTLDSDISYGLPDAFISEDKHLIVPSSLPAVLEVKYDSVLPAWLISSFARYGISLETNSKYCQGMRTMYGII